MAELKTFVFSDICRSVELKNEMTGASGPERDEAFIQKILTPHRARIEGELAEYGGRVVSTSGDGHFLAFDDTVSASRWAVKVQQSHQRDPIATPRKDRVAVRMSMHTGIPQTDPAAPGNFIGMSVDYAARLNALANGDQILVSLSVKALLNDVGLDDVRFHLHGRRTLKGIGEVDVYELIYDKRGPREIRPQPKSDSRREWTVIATEGFDNQAATGRHGQSATVGNATLKHVGNYILEKLIGSGGMGEVYKARHMQFNRVRAVKVIRPELVAGGNTELIRRFYQEIKAVGALEHRNIVVAIDSSLPSDQIHYLVMEYIEGASLSDLVERHGPLSAPDAAEIIRQAARGLQFIHKNSMVHRDIKPSNLMLTTVDADGISAGSGTAAPSEGTLGVVKILDLGLALLAGDNHERLTRFDNKAMGTGMYMSPEQWKATTVDNRADIYSLGCTFYHLLSGMPPFADSDLKPQKAHEKLPVPKLSAIPSPLDEVLQKMMAKQPDDRFATAAEVADALAPSAVGHNLPALLHDYGTSGASSTANVNTPAISKTKTDSQRSWTDRMHSTRRRLRRMVPACVVIGLVAAVWIVRHVDNRERLFQAEQAARDNLPVVAKVAATKTLADEIQSRLDLLTSVAMDPALRSQLAQINAAPVDRELWMPLKEWLLHQVDANQEAASAECWFILDAHGVQVARSPFKSSVGQRFSYRDYFHGQGYDLDPDEAADLKPIRKPTISTVFRSTTDDEFRVAFSVPVWDDGAVDKREVLGVLAMTVDLGQFTVLERELSGGHQVLLVDLREDHIDEKHPQRGVILHHPHLTDWWLDGLEKLPPRIDPGVLAAMQSSPAGFVNGYADPIAKDHRFWGAFESVNIGSHTEGGEGTPTGWMVLVQSEIPD